MTVSEWGLVLALLGAIGLVAAAAEAWGRPARYDSRHRPGKHREEDR